MVELKWGESRYYKNSIFYIYFFNIIVKEVVKESFLYFNC